MLGGLARGAKADCGLRRFGLPERGGDAARIDGG